MSKDQHQFILPHYMMGRQTNDQIAVIIMVTKTKKRSPILNACSFDQGVRLPANQAELARGLEQATSSKKQTTQRAHSNRANGRID